MGGEVGDEKGWPEMILVLNLTSMHLARLEVGSVEHAFKAVLQFFCNSDVVPCAEGAPPGWSGVDSTHW
jgi:hypothetical protein